MRDLPLARAYQKHGYGLGGVLLKQSLYPGSKLLELLEGAGLVVDLGCGEGMLTHLLARRLPHTRFLGIDLDAEKIAVARAAFSGPQIEFQSGDLFDHPVRGASAVLFNDVLHHLPADRQLAALKHAAKGLNDDGLLILKEVDPADRLDVMHTTFWDSRLYPRDTLTFASPREWIARAEQAGLRHLGSCRVRHPWIASRSMLWFTRRPKLATFIAAPSPTRPLPERTVLVTGGTGFIGEWLVRQLLAEGLDGAPVHVDLLTRRPSAVPADLRSDERLRLLTGDLTDEKFTAALTGSWSAVFHLAAAVDYFGGAAVYENNLRATTNLLAACERLGVGRFIYASTMGALDRSRWDSARRPLDESSQPHPTSPYGRAKVAEEELVRRSPLAWSIVRIPWCYGPGMAETHHVRNLLGRVRRGAAICRIRWPGRVSVIEVREAARQFRAIAANPRTSRQTFFLAENQPVSFGDLFAEMGRTVGQPSAGALRFPSWFWSVLRIGAPLAPFQLKCLITDALVVSPAHAASLGVAPAPRTSEFLQPLARYDALQRFPLRHRSAVLITGAAGGIGACFARIYHANGYALLLADRNADALAERCRDYHASGWVVDLADPSLPNTLASSFPDRFPWPVVLINNAGVGWRGLAWTSSPEQLALVTTVNATAPALLSQFFLQHGPGSLVIVNITSTAAFQPLAYMAAYAAAKSFALSFSLSLASEVRAQGRPDHVLTVIPAGTQTGFQSAAGVKTGSNEKLLSPELVAAAAIEAARSRRSLLLVGRSAWLMYLAARVVPLSRQGPFWERLMARMR